MNVAGLEKHRTNHGDGGSDDASREGKIARSTVTSGEGGGHGTICAGRTISTVGRGTGARITISTFIRICARWGTYAVDWERLTVPVEDEVAEVDLADSVAAPAVMLNSVD